MTATAFVSGPAEIVALLPYQLGFHPRRSLVVVGMRGNRSVGLIQRIDLPPPDGVLETAAALANGLRRDDSRAALLVGFEDEQGEAVPMLHAAAAVCRAEGVVPSDRLVVRDGRWWSLDCTDRRCCPRKGRPVPSPDEVPAVAEFVAAEVAPLADRADIERRLEPQRPLLIAAVAAATADAIETRLRAMEPTDADPDADDALAVQRETELALWSAVLAHGDDAGLTGQASRHASRQVTRHPGHLATMAVSLLDRDLRDAMISALCRGWMDLDRFEPSLAEAVRRHISPLAEPPRSDSRSDSRSDFGAARRERRPGRGRGGTQAPGPARFVSSTAADDLWRISQVNRVQDRLVTLCASLPPKWTPGPLSVLAWLAWWRGDGALTRVALDRALGVDPGYRLAQLMTRMLDHAVRPDELSGRRDDRPTGGPMAV